MRRAAKRDANEPELVALFKAYGCEVERLSQKGLPDLLVLWGWGAPQHLKSSYRMALCEVKVEKGKLRETQNEFASRFPVWIVRDAVDVRTVCQWLKS